MAISDELTRLQNAKSALKTSIEAKGVTVSDTTLISGYAALVDEIQTGGGGNEDLIDLIERNITTFNIPSGTTKIGDNAFYSCTGLISVTIPNSVTSIGQDAFLGCTDLTSVTIGNSVTSIGNQAFGDCSGLTSVTIPNSVTNIEQAAFLGCRGLTSVTIGNSVTNIGSSAFDSCYKLTSVIIPNSVARIGGFAFYECSGLTNIVIEATTPPVLDYNAFGDTNDCPIYVPSESVEAYKAASGWSKYASRIQAITV